MNISLGNMLVFSDMKKTKLFASYCLSKIVILMTLLARLFSICSSVQRQSLQQGFGMVSFVWSKFIQGAHIFRRSSSMQNQRGVPQIPLFGRQSENKAVYTTASDAYGSGRGRDAV